MGGFSHGVRWLSLCVGVCHLEVELMPAKEGECEEWGGYCAAAAVHNI